MIAAAAALLAGLCGGQAALAADLGRRSGWSVVVAPGEARTPATERFESLLDLARSAELLLEETEGFLVLRRPAPPSVPVDATTLERAHGGALLFGPDAWPGEPVRGRPRSGVLVLRRGDRPAREAVQAADARAERPALPPADDCRGPVVRLCARDAPLGSVVDRLAALSGRPLALEGGDPAEPVSLHLETVPWEQALVALAWATDRSLALDASGGATLHARRRVSAAIRWADPLATLELLARAAGRRLILPRPATRLEPTSLHLSRVPIREALPLAAELLGFALEPDPSGALRVRRAGRPVDCTRQPLPYIRFPRTRAWDVRGLLSRQLERASTGEPGRLDLPRRGCLPRGADPAAWDVLERSLETWLPTWNPDLPREVASALAGAVVDGALGELDEALDEGRPDEVFGRLPELTELAARIARRDRVEAERLLAGVRECAARAEPLALLLLRSGGVLQGTLRGEGLELALIDGRVIAPGEPLIDRAGVPRRDALLVGVPGLERAVVRSGGQELERVLPHPAPDGCAPGGER